MFITAVLTIYMSGLMTHVGVNADETVDDHKSHVVLVAAAHHEPQIIVLGSDLVPPQPKPLIIPLKQGDVVTWENVTAGTADPDSTFNNYVPSLAPPVTKGTLLAAVKKPKTQHYKVAASMIYPEGTLSIAAYFANKLKFARGADTWEHCVPSLVQFETVPKDEAKPVTLVIDHAGTSTDTRHNLTANASLLLINESTMTGTPTDAQASAHFKNFLGLTSGKIIATVSKGSQCAMTPVLFRTDEMTAAETSRDSRAETAAALMPSLFLKFLLVNHPACTNTDFP